MFSEAAITHGGVLAALGNCAVCHGPGLAGGVLLQTPFGTITTPNITPDESSGVGTWSYAAFARAMRDGVGRDGGHLYPALPYTHFRTVTEPDLQALYAWLMSRPAVTTPPRAANALRFPFNLRPLLAGWNALFLRGTVFTPDAARSAAWNRGAYLVNGLGHCGGCHSPRNWLGAERTGAAALAGGMAQGWAAQSLTAASQAPLPWTEADYAEYLRTGFSANHGPAGGPMADVVQQLRGVPDADVKAMAVYLASLSPGAASVTAEELERQTAPGAATSVGARLYDGACAACHQAGRVVFGVRPSLALNSNVHDDTPDTLIRVILQGAGSFPERGVMPAFGGSLDDTQVAELVRFVRAQFAPGRTAWSGVEDAVARLRSQAAAP